LHIIDRGSHRVFINPQRRKDDLSIASALIRCWKIMGVPDFLQLDNELSFRGSNRHPRSLGIVLRLCLMMGIEVVFIPVGEPWRNAVVESFNDTYNRRFFRRQFFRSYLQLRAQSKNFEIFHNQNHRYGYLQGSTPFQFLQDAGFKPLFAPPKFTLPKISYIPDGTISIIRFIRSDRKLDIWGENFQLPQSSVYSYVRAKIITHLHEIQVFHGEDLVAVFSYALPPWIDSNP
jgi:putative transposase